MTSEFVLQNREKSVDRVGRVRYSQIARVGESEQPRQVRFQTPIRTAKTFVRVETFARLRIYRSLVDELFPLLKPACQAVCKLVLVGLCQCQCKCS